MKLEVWKFRKQLHVRKHKCDEEKAWSAVSGSAVETNELLHVLNWKKKQDVNFVGQNKAQGHI